VFWLAIKRQEKGKDGQKIVTKSLPVQIRRNKTKHAFNTI
jgi:hypothetical protein